MITGTGTRSGPVTRAGTAGRGPGGHLGALGLEVNLFKLGGYGDGRVGNSFTAIEPSPGPLMLGEDPWGLESHAVSVRRAAAEAQRMETMNRMLDEDASAARAAEREKAIRMTQEAYESAGDTQRLILTSGSMNLNKVLRSTTIVGILALGAFAVTAIFSNLGKKKRDVEDWEHQKRYRSYQSKPRSRSRSYRSRRGSFKRSSYTPQRFSAPTSPVLGGSQ